MKSKYETHVEPRFDEIAAWCRDGLTDEQIAKNCGVAESTFSEYKNRHPELKELLARTKAIVDNVEVVNAYLRRITGYTAIEVKREYGIIHNKETGKMERVLLKETEQERHIPGDPRGMETWLAMRQKETWGALRQKGGFWTDSEDEGNTGVVMIPEKRVVDEDE